MKSFAFLILGVALVLSSSNVNSCTLGPQDAMALEGLICENWTSGVTLYDYLYNRNYEEHLAGREILHLDCTNRTRQYIFNIIERYNLRPY